MNFVEQKVPFLFALSISRLPQSREITKIFAILHCFTCFFGKKLLTGVFFGTKQSVYH